MATTTAPPPESEKRAEEVSVPAGPAQQEPQKLGFFALLIKSVFEPGANSAVVLAMNLSFFFLLLTLFGLAFLTNWNLHVLALMAINLILWAAMIWFVMQLTKVQANPENMPVAGLVPEAEGDETRKDR